MQALSQAAEQGRPEKGEFKQKDGTSEKDSTVMKYSLII